MNKKTSLSLALCSALSVSNIVSADIITFTFDGLFSVSNLDGVVQLNSDDSNGSNYGFYTDVSGSGSFNTNTELMSYSLDTFSFFGAGAVFTGPQSFSVIGDGAGGAGSLINAAMHFDWYFSGSLYEWQTPFAIQDASGFLANLPSAGRTTTIGSDCLGCSVSTTSDWVFGPEEFGFNGSVGSVPIAMTNFNSAFPLVDDGVSGIPMTNQQPILGYNIGLDFTSITATNLTAVPLPASAWLFCSGLIGLVGFARRKQSS